MKIGNSIYAFGLLVNVLQRLRLDRYVFHYSKDFVEAAKIENQAEEKCILIASNKTHFFFDMTAAYLKGEILEGAVHPQIHSRSSCLVSIPTKYTEKMNKTAFKYHFWRCAL